MNLEILPKSANSSPMPMNVQSHNAKDCDSCNLCNHNNKTRNQNKDKLSQTTIHGKRHCIACDVKNVENVSLIIFFCLFKTINNFFFNVGFGCVSNKYLK